MSTKKNSLWAILIALWIIFILVSQVPFLAENLFRSTANMDDHYESHLTFPEDGKRGHYYVERYDINKPGLINVNYTTATNSLEVDCTNIKVLKIYCREMYEKKSEDVFKRDPNLDSNYYKTYFINRDHFHVHVYTKQMIEQLEWIDTPIPYNVTVNGREWWLTKINYTYDNDGIVFTKVPPGHNYVDIYFKSNNLNSPVALFSASKTVIGLGESITLNASSSYDPDGEIISYVWDMGEGSYKIGVTTEFTYSTEGIYKMILTVKDNDYLIDRAFLELKVVRKIMSISKSVDKPIATPGSTLTYTITPTIDASWTNGVKDIVIEDTLPEGLTFIAGTPLPQVKDRTLTWKINSMYKTQDITPIVFQGIIEQEVENGTIISNYATVDYTNMAGQEFAQELTNLVNTKVKVSSLLAPQIRERVPDITLAEDDPPYNLYLNQYEYDLQDSGSNLTWYITGENDSLFILSGEYSDSDILTITPIANAYGTNLVTLWLEDSKGYTTNQPLWINITSVNDNPIFMQSPDLIIHYGKPYTFDYFSYISDIDSPMEQWELFAQENTFEDQGEDTTSEHIQIDGFKITYNYPVDYVDKRVYVSLIVYDGDYGSDGDTITINITDDETPALMNELPDVWLFEGETKSNVFDLDDYFDDPDSDALFYTFGDTHVYIQINEDHSVDISSLSDWHGVDIVTFRATDPIGALAEDTILVTVTPINDPPVISGIPDTFIVHYGVDYAFDLTPYITDKDNELNDLQLILADEYIRVDPLNPFRIIMNYPQNMIGMEVKVIFVVSDGLDTASATSTVKVTEYWPPDIREDLPDIAFYEDTTLTNAFNLNEYFIDKDSDTLFYTYGNKNVNISIQSNKSVDFSASLNWHGVEIVTFRATDPTFAFVENVIYVTVIPVNDPPTIMPLPDQSGTEKQLWKFDLTEYIDDIDNDITDLKVSAHSEKFDVEVKGRELIIYSLKPELDVITITVSDGHLESYGEMLVEIKGIEQKSSEDNTFFYTILWLLILVIIIIVSIMGYTSYRRYTGTYEVEDLFWIHDEGILLFHETAPLKKADPESKKNEPKKDDDVLSGMLTAILSFTEDAFASDDVGSKSIWGVKEIQMKGKNILVERGKYTFLATIFEGKSGKKLYSESRTVLKSVEFKYGQKLKDWDGKIKPLNGAKKILKTMFPPGNKKNN